jgi:hypothetical protein
MLSLGCHSRRHRNVSFASIFALKESLATLRIRTICGLDEGHCRLKIRHAYNRDPLFQLTPAMRFVDVISDASRIGAAGTWMATSC